jgi:hypothetical protein
MGKFPDNSRAKPGYALTSYRKSTLANPKGEIDMPKFVIERNIPGIGAAGPSDLQAAAQKSNGVLSDLGAQIQWVHSYVTDDKTYCVYLAPSKELIEEHARRSGFPANRISEVKSLIDPNTARAS